MASIVRHCGDLHEVLLVVKRLAWQFSIRTLLLGIAALGLALAIGRMIGAAWMSLAVWTLLLVAAHVAGIVIARRRPDTGSESQGSLLDAQVARGGPLPILRHGVPHQLTESQPLAGWVRRCAIGGVILGALGGLAGMWLLRVTTAYGLILGTLSASVLGGFFAFMTGSFLAIAANAFGEATRNEDRQQLDQSNSRRAE